MYKLLVIIGVSISNALVVMQFDWERGNWTFMISFSIISTFLSWNIVDLSVSLYLPYISPISPLYLPYISPISPP